MNAIRNVDCTGSLRFLPVGDVFLHVGNGVSAKLTRPDNGAEYDVYAHSASSVRFRACAGLGACAAMALIVSSACAGASSPLPRAAATVIVPRNLGYWAMVANASPIVQAVLIVLLLASVATWTIWLAKFF